MSRGSSPPRRLAALPIPQGQNCRCPPCPISTPRHVLGAGGASGDGIGADQCFVLVAEPGDRATGALLFPAETGMVSATSFNRGGPQARSVLNLATRGPPQSRVAQSSRHPLRSHRSPPIWSWESVKASTPTITAASGRPSERGQPILLFAPHQIASTEPTRFSCTAVALPENVISEDTRFKNTSSLKPALGSTPALVNRQTVVARNPQITFATFFAILMICQLLFHLTLLPRSV